VNESERPAPEAPVTDTSPETNTEALRAAPVPAPAPDNSAPEPIPGVDPVRAAAGRLGGQRVHKLAELGRQYEKEHGLKPGRQRLKQLIQLGKRYEVEHGLRAAEPRRRKKGDAWQEFLAALARVVAPAYRPFVENLASALRPNESGPAATGG
jgi:hypothetical protein